MKLIKLQNKFILVSDEEIKQNDWYIDTTVDSIFKNDKFFLNGVGYKKIIAGIPELPKVDLSDLKEEDCKTIGWVDVEKLAENKYPILKGGSMWMPSSDDCNKANKQEAFKEGFKTAQSLNDKNCTCQQKVFNVETILKNNVYLITKIIKDE